MLMFFALFAIQQVNMLSAIYPSRFEIQDFILAYKADEFHTALKFAETWYLVDA